MAASRSGAPAEPGTTADLTATMLRVREGDQAAFAVLYDLLAPRVFGLVLRLLVDRAQAEEVTQEVFIELWRKAKGFDDRRGSVIAWALSISHAKAVDRIRASQAQRDRDERIGRRDTDAEFDTVSETVELRLESQRASEALAALPPPQRDAIRLAYFDGLTQREIAERLHVPLGTVKTRIRDGMTRLRALLEVTT